MNLNYTVENDNFISINQVLKQELNISSRLITKLIHDNKVLLNGNVCDTRDTPFLNDKITVLLDNEEDSSNIIATKMTLTIMYEDECFLVLNKPAGVATHPSLRHYSDSLSNGVKYYFNEIGLKKKIRPINRLDIDTSGLVIFAKNEYVQECLNRQTKERQLKKEYICIVTGLFDKKNGTIDAPIARKEKSIIERCVSIDGKPSVTHYSVIQEVNSNSIVKCILETGRTHQIRVHMAYMGHPILGDTLYGQKSCLISRQALHCSKLEFIHPITKKIIKVETELPEDFQKLSCNSYI